MAAALSTRSWPRLLRPIVSRPHLMAGAAAGAAVFFLAVPLAHRAVTRGLIAWDVATAVFIVMSFGSMIGIGHEEMKRRAIEHDEGRHAILALTVISAVVSVAAIVAELGAARGAEAASHLFHVSLAAGTIALSWVFVQTVFSVHYAHVFYCAEDVDAAHRGGLEFPGGETAPDYWDFVYFAFVIGATSQTADVEIASREMRRVATLHGLTAFAFNTAILATMINLAAGLI